MGELNKRLKKDDSRLRIEESEFKGYLVTTFKEKSWHIVSDFTKGGMKVACKSKTIRPEDRIILYDFIENTFYNSKDERIDTLNIATDTCNECMPTYKEITPW